MDNFYMCSDIIFSVQDRKKVKLAQISTLDEYINQKLTLNCTERALFYYKKSYIKPIKVEDISVSFLKKINSLQYEISQESSLKQYFYEL